MTTEEQNPFIAHRALLMNPDYGTAELLRQLALYLWNSEAYLCSLAALARSADAKHWKIAMDMVGWYRAHGEGDQAFMDLCGYIVDFEQGYGDGFSEGLNRLEPFSDGEAWHMGWTTAYTDGFSNGFANGQRTAREMADE